MYSPARDGIERSAQSVQYAEAKPSRDLAAYVDCLWELKTDGALAEDFHLHALPDACVNIMFNQLDTRIAGVTALRTTYEVLNLGKKFHYAGIQFLPGVWQGNRDEIFDRYVGEPYTGSLSLVAVNEQLAKLDFTAKQSVMAELVQRLISDGTVVPNEVTEAVLANLDNVQTVGDMAALVGLSPRQLQRVLKQTTGFSPHDLLKVLRLQRSFKQNYHEFYTDQAHFIHSFRKITGYTPEKYFKKFDV